MTDVEDLHKWMVDHISAFPLFQRLSEEEYADDPVVPKLLDSSEVRCVQ